MATVSNGYIKGILDELPIGYYLGSRAEVKFSEDAETSYCNPITGEVVVAARNVHECLKTLKDTSDTASFVRGALYHEVSHLILTPRKMDYSPWMNIFEDARIEARLAKYFRDVDFQRQVLLLNDWDESWKPHDALSMFFGICRFFQGPAKFVRKAKDLIAKHARINAASESWIYNRYWYEIKDFWEKVASEWPKEARRLAAGAARKAASTGDEVKPGKGGVSEDKDEDSKDKDSKDKGEGKEEGKGEAQEAEVSPGGERDERKDLAAAERKRVVRKAERKAEAMREELEKVFEAGSVADLSLPTVASMVGQIMEEYHSPALEAELSRILARATKHRGQFAGHVNGYSGRVDPRAVGMRDDYRWLVRPGEDCHGKFQGTHITLWVDVSGSFYDSIDNVNKLIHALTAIEKASPRMFSFDVVAMNEENVAWDKTQAMVACGGNNFGPDIDTLARKFDRKGWRNYSVMVFDGDMNTDCDYAPDGSRLGWAMPHQKVDAWRRAYDAVDNPRTIIVTDTSNQKYLDYGCPSARKVYIEDNYDGKFIENVVKLLSHVVQ